MLIFTSSMQAYFREALSHALEESRVELTEEAKVYLVHFLNDFSRSEKLFAGTDYGEKISIFNLLERATQAEGPEAVQIYRHMGDISLYLLGFFREADVRRPASRSYYLSMGSKGYAQVSALFRCQALNSAILFHELSERFADMVRVVEEVAKYHQFKKN